MCLEMLSRCLLRIHHLFRKFCFRKKRRPLFVFKRKRNGAKRRTTYFKRSCLYFPLQLNLQFFLLFSNNLLLFFIVVEIVIETKIVYKLLDWVTRQRFWSLLAVERLRILFEHELIVALGLLWIFKQIIKLIVKLGIRIK